MPLPGSTVIRLGIKQERIASSKMALISLQLAHIPRLDVPGAWLADCSADRERVCLALTGELSEHRDVSAISAARLMVCLEW
jgi:hypothetical protein